MTIPSRVEDFTAGWFSEVLDADISAVDVLDAHSGTTGRARVRVTTHASLPETLFVKLQPFLPEQQEFVRMVGMGVSEARLYAAVGDDLPVRIPRIRHSSFGEGDDSFIMVLEDLQASGCRFPSAEDDDVFDVPTSLMDELAALHAAYWQQDLSRLKPAAGYRNTAQGAKVAVEAADIMQSALDQFADDMPPAFRRKGELYISRLADINALYREGERTLIHGDAHIGNLFVDREGRTGFYDSGITSDTVERILLDEEHPSDGPIAKLSYTEMNVELCQLALELLGSSASIDNGGAETAERWHHNFLWSRALTISGGSSEIMRGLIGRQLLGLPRA